METTASVFEVEGQLMQSKADLGRRFHCALFLLTSDK